MNQNLNYPEFQDTPPNSPVSPPVAVVRRHPATEPRPAVLEAHDNREVVIQSERELAMLRRNYLRCLQLKNSARVAYARDIATIRQNITNAMTRNQTANQQNAELVQTISQLRSGQLNPGGGFRAWLHRLGSKNANLEPVITKRLCPNGKPIISIKFPIKPGRQVANLTGAAAAILFNSVRSFAQQIDNSRGQPGAGGVGGGGGGAAVVLTAGGDFSSNQGPAILTMSPSYFHDCPNYRNAHMIDRMKTPSGFWNTQMRGMFDMTQSPDINYPWADGQSPGGQNFFSGVNLAGTPIPSPNTSPALPPNMDPGSGGGNGCGGCGSSGASGGIPSSSCDSDLEGMMQAYFHEPSSGSPLQYQYRNDAEDAAVMDAFFAEPPEYRGAPSNCVPPNAGAAFVTQPPAPFQQIPVAIPQQPQPVATPAFVPYENRPWLRNVDGERYERRFLHHSLPGWMTDWDASYTFNDSFQARHAENMAAQNSYGSYNYQDESPPNPLVPNPFRICDFGPQH